MFNSEQLGGILRAILAAAGGSLVAKGVVDAGTATAVSGALVTILTAGWSWYTNKPGTVIAPNA